MSKYLNIEEMNIQDQDLLVKTLQNDVTFRTGKGPGTILVESHDGPVHLYGFVGDVRPEMAEVVVRRKYVGASANDIGFARQPNGNFKPVISGFDNGFYNDSWRDSVVQAYAEGKYVQDMYAEGWTVSSRTVDQQGEVALEFQPIGGI